MHYSKRMPFTEAIYNFTDADCLVALVFGRHCSTGICCATSNAVRNAVNESEEEK